MICKREREIDLRGKKPDPNILPEMDPGATTNMETYALFELFDTSTNSPPHPRSSLQSRINIPTKATDVIHGNKKGFLWSITIRAQTPQPFGKRSPINLCNRMCNLANGVADFLAKMG